MSGPEKALSTEELLLAKERIAAIRVQLDKLQGTTVSDTGCTGQVQERTG